MRLKTSARALFLAGVVSALRMLASKDAGQAGHGCTVRPALDREGFQSVMQALADGWNHGDAKEAASCFAENAIYSGPPLPPHRGRAAIYEFFGGAKGRVTDAHNLASPGIRPRSADRRRRVYPSV